MGSNVSIAEALAQLESKIAYHKEQEGLHIAQEAHHAEREAFHAEQKGHHEVEHREAVERYEAFKAASESIGGMLVDVKPPALAPALAPLSEDIAAGGWRLLSQLMSRVIESKGPDEVFGASTLIAEIHKRWGAKLK